MIKKIFKKTVIIASLVFLFLSILNPVSAGYDFKKDSGISQIATPAGYSETKDTEFYIGKILLLAFSFVGIVFMGLIIYSGIMWMTAQGNETQVGKAKNTIIKSIVGLVIIMAAYAITFFVTNYVQKTPPVPVNTQNND